MIFDLSHSIRFDRIQAHRNVLHSANEYFKKLFKSPLNDGVTVDNNQHPVFMIRGVAGRLLKSFISFCNDGKLALDIDDDNVHDILAAASMLQFDRIKLMCVDYLKERLRLSNCLSTWLVAEHFGLKEIADEAFDMVIWNFKKVIKEEEFLNIKLEPLQILLSHDDLNVYSEEQIFEAMASWIDFKYAEEERKSAFPELIKTVRLNHLKATVSGWATYTS